MAKTSGNRNSGTELLNPSATQGAVMSGPRGQRRIDVIPYGLASSLGLSRRTQSPWRLFRNSRGLVARRNNHADMPLDTNPWRSRMRRGGIALRFWLAADDAALIEARELLERSHPRRSPSNGVYLLCGVEDTSWQQQILNQGRIDPLRPDPWSTAWNQDASHVVGCVALSRLFHGQPRGRAEVAANAGVELSAMPSRRAVVDSLGLVWMSRIAVDAPYRGLDIGTAMATEVRRIARRRLPWKSDRVEVIRTVPAADVDAIRRKGDFFTRAGYRLADVAMPCAATRTLTSNGGWAPAPELYRQLYYWCDT